MYGNFLKFSLISTILILPSAFGRTPLLAIFKPFLEKTLSISAGQMGFIYSAGTISASVLTGVFGAILIKKLSIKKILISTYALFAFVYLCFVLVCKSVPGALLSVFILIALFAGIRFCAQGMIPLIIRNMSCLLCTSKQCSWIAAVHSTLLVLAVGILSRILVSLSSSMDWPIIWIIEAVALSVVSVAFINRLPSSLISASPEKWNFKIVKADKLGLFLLCTVILGVHNLQATGISFHLSTLAAERNVDIADAFSIFLPISVLGLVFNPICSFIATRVKLMTLVVFLALSIVLISVSLRYFDTVYGRYFIIISSAIGWSFNHVICYLISASFFDKSIISAGNTFVISATSLLSALGPLIMSIIAYFLNNSYVYANYIIASLVVILASIAVVKNCTN